MARTGDISIPLRTIEHWNSVGSRTMQSIGESFLQAGGGADAILLVLGIEIKLWTIRRIKMESEQSSKSSLVLGTS
jgi:hypothetical protein